MDTTKSGPRLRLVGRDGDATGEGGAVAAPPAAPAGRHAVSGAHTSGPTGAMPAAFWTRRVAVEPDRPALLRRAAIEEPEREVERENIGAAAAMAATDPRWVMALRVYESIEGGRAAILRPDKRRTLVGLATRLGLRAFDANLIIAIVQDAARCGERPMGPGVSDRLTLVRAAGDAGAREGRFGLRVLLGAMGVAAVLGDLLLDMLIGWVARETPGHDGRGGPHAADRPRNTSTRL